MLTSKTNYETNHAGRSQAMGDRFYATCREFGRFVKRQCIRETVFNVDRVARFDEPDDARGVIFAPTHVSHVEPLLLACSFDRPINWMARIEFFRFKPLGLFLHYNRAFCVNRQGVPVRAIRRAIELARSSEIVGIFPEGGCRKGTELAVRGGRIKQGLCTVSIRAQVPIVPVVMLGTHALNDIESWLPGLRRKTWVNFGDPIDPPAMPSRRQFRTVRRAYAEQIERTYVETYRELLEHADLRDAMTP